MTFPFSYLFIILTIFTSFYAHSGAGRSSFVDLSDKRIQLIQGDLSRLYIYDVNMIDSDCDIKNVSTLFFNKGEISKEIYSLLLAAKTAGKRVDIIAGSCVQIGRNTYPLITSVYME